MITLFDDYVIDADDNCYIMGKLKPVKVKDGDSEKIVMRVNKPKYYTTVSDAIQGFFNAKSKETISSSDFDLSEAITALKRLSDDIRSLIKNVEEMK